jgi:virulence factor Mce-like protein
MILRIGGVVLLLAAVAAGVLLLTTREDTSPRYTMEFDNAFGLTEGTELRAAGVEIGSVETLELDQKTARALVEVKVNDTSFGDFREDVECAIEPQSLIGEYYVNCEPGTAPGRLEDGARVPVEQTTTTIPPDLVVNIMRRPWRERFGLILAEMGAGLAARGPELNETIRRALPALRETDKVLEILSDNRERLRRLTRDADTVMAALSRRRDDVARFVVETRDVSRATAERRAELQENLRLLPPFLRELRPAMRDLGIAAERQTPALRDLRLASDDLQLVFERLGPFSRASRPALRSLGDAAETGIPALRAIRPTVRRLAALGRNSGDPLGNLRHVLEHVDDRDNAIHPNPLSPTGRGFTGLEAFLQYPFVQSQAINIFDTRGYILKINIIPSQCTQYKNAESVRNDPQLREQCSAELSDNPKYGIDFAIERRDENPYGSGARRARGTDAGDEAERENDAEPGSGSDDSAGGSDDEGAERSLPRELLEVLKSTPEDANPAPADARAADPDSDALLDFLFAP